MRRTGDDIRGVLVTLLATGLLAGCTGGGDGVAPSPSPSPAATSPTTATSPTAAASATSPADEPPGDERALDEQLAFVLGLLDGAELSEQEYEEAFADTFVEQVGYDEFTQITAQVAQSAPWTLEREIARTTDAISVELVGGDGSRVVVDLAVDDDGRIDELLIRPAQPPALDDQPSSVEEAMDRLDQLGTLRWAASEVSASECTVTSGRGVDEQAPIGSVFKLYVLGAVTDAIEDGTLAWDDQLEVTDEVRSLPSGVLQTRPAGATVTVEEAARLMISISDNTATDLLLRTVGRGRVEQAQAEWGHSAPQRNVPFLTTRELFVLKAADEATRTAWVQGDEAARRDLLDQLAGEPLPDVSRFTGDPLQPDVIEWFASPGDLCRVLARLRDAARQPGLEPLEEILTANPGVPDDGRWASVWFKGGSEPGLLAMAFLVVDGQGTAHALTGSVVSAEEAFDQTEAVLLFAAARDLLPVG